jgi:hypothetical protein
MKPLERLQILAVAVAALSALLGLLSSGGCSPLPQGSAHWAWLIHLPLFGLGAVGGFLTTRRLKEVEDQRWQAARDPGATKGERKLAHREAERQRRHAGTAFLLAPLGVALWMTYQFESQGQFTASDLYLASPLVGFLLGLLLSRWRQGPEDPLADL